MRRSVVLGVGAALPVARVSNDDLVGRGVDTSDDWIRQRTGIAARHLAGEGETTVSLATAAAREALDRAGLPADAVDLIVVATTTPDDTFPSSATRVQAALGIHHGFAFDVQAVCSGFVYALATADNFLRVGQARTALVIGAETFSRLLDWNDRTTCVLFGDGAGAVVLQSQDGEGTSADRGVLTTHLHSDGAHRDALYVDGGPSTTGSVGHVRMKGQEVFRHAVKRLAEVVDEALEAAGVAPDAIDWLVPHQANRRIIDAMGRKLGLPPEKVVVTVEHHANTSAASIPLALAEAAADGRIRPGHLVLIEAMGGGFTWGSSLIRW
ncbi:MAG: beta-ketoacyl-ACP synthase III [Alphaproteobacteria bacterium]